MVPLAIFPSSTVFLLSTSVNRRKALVREVRTSPNSSIPIRTKAHRNVSCLGFLHQFATRHHQQNAKPIPEKRSQNCRPGVVRVTGRWHQECIPKCRQAGSEAVPSLRQRDAIHHVARLGCGRRRTGAYGVAAADARHTFDQRHRVGPCGDVVHPVQLQAAPAQYEGTPGEEGGEKSAARHRGPRVCAPRERDAHRAGCGQRDARGTG